MRWKWAEAIQSPFRCQRPTAITELKEQRYTSMVRESRLGALVDVTTASIAASGTLSPSVRAAVRVLVKFTWKGVTGIGRKVGGGVIEYTWVAPCAREDTWWLHLHN